MSHPLFSHPAEEGPSLEAPAHDGGDAASALDGLPRERALAYARVEQAGSEHPMVRLLRSVGEAATGWSGGEAIGFDLPDPDEADLSLLTGVLGRGEVAGHLDDGTAFEEAVCPGIWLVERNGRLGLEVGTIPSAVRERILRLPLLSAPVAEALPEGVMNILPVLGEMATHAAAWHPDAAPHGVNLSLLPFSPVDTMVLEAELGRGPVAFESKGYGFARIQATGRRHIWRTRFFNSQGTPIQDILEICDIPAGAQATLDDIQDGGERLLSILAIYA